MRIKRLLSLVFLAIALAAGALFFWRGNSETHLEDSEAARTSHLRKAPDFELTDSKGHKHKLSEFRGNAVVIHFWASWCPPCLGEIPHWVELAQEFKGKKLKLIAVSTDTKWEDALKVLPEGKAQEILSLLDATGKSAEDFGTYQYPETYVINAEQEIVTKWIGSQDWKNPALLDFLRKLTPS